MQESNYTKIFTGGLIESQLIQTRLESIDIEPILKDQSNLGLSAALVTEYPKLIEVFVNNDELEKAIPIVEEVLAELQA